MLLRGDGWVRLATRLSSPSSSSSSSSSSFFISTSSPNESLNVPDWLPHMSVQSSMGYVLVDGGNFCELITTLSDGGNSMMQYLVDHIFSLSCYGFASRWSQFQPGVPLEVPGLSDVHQVGTHHLSMSSYHGIYILEIFGWFSHHVDLIMGNGPCKGL